MKIVCAVIPALNEAPRIGAVIDKIRAQDMDVIVVDDGSTDATSETAKRSASFVLFHNVTRGKGAALKTGLEFAVEKGYEVAVILDGDAQHDPSEIPVLINEFNLTGSDMIAANRMHDPKGMPPIRIFVNKIGSKIVSALCGGHIPDAFTGYKIVRLNILQSITLESDGYEIDPEMLIKAMRAGYKIGHVNTSCIYEGQKSRIRVLPDGYKLLRMFVSLLFYRRKRR